MTVPQRVQSPQTHDHNRLALLWKAFEDAEQRIAELESELDRRRAAPPPPVSAPEKDRTRELEQSLARAQAALALAREDAARALARQSFSAEIELRTERASHQAELSHLADELALARAETERASSRAAILTEVDLLVEREQRRAALEGWDRAGADAVTAWRLVDALVRTAASMEDALAESALLLGDEQARLGVLEEELRDARARTLAAEGARIDIIPGIRGTEVASLRACGVNVHDTLLFADLSALSLSAGMGLPRLARLRALAELMTLGGLAPADAERLFQHGARGVRDVASMGPARIAEALLDRPRVEDLAEDDALRNAMPAHAEAIYIRASAERTPRDGVLDLRG